MDHSEPPPPPPALHAAALPTKARVPFARGNAPEWTLVDRSDHMELTIVGVAPIRLDRGEWRDTPAGRTLTMRDREGKIVSLQIAHGVCRDFRGQPAGLVIAGRFLPGCLLEDGDRPYDGGR